MGMGLVLSRDRMLVQDSEPKGKVVESKNGWAGRRFIIQSFMGQSKGFRFFPKSQERTLKHVNDI